MPQKNTIQPLEWDNGVIRFKANAIVRYLLDYASSKGCDLNDLARMPFTNDDWTQMAQLMGYSVSGAGDLDYFDREVLEIADRRADAMLAAREK